MILFRLRDAVDKVLREEQRIVRRGEDMSKKNFHSWVKN